MFKARATLLSFFYFLLNQVYGQYTEVDLRSDLNGGKNYIGIAIRDNTTSGHAFIILGKENSEKAISELSAIGFYPNGAVFYGDGEIRNDFVSLKYVTESDQMYFIVDDNAYNTAVQAVVSWSSSPPDYNIVGNNCIDLIQDITYRIGVSLPPRGLFSLKPAGYLKKIKNHLYSKNGLGYLNNTKIISHNGDIYIGQTKDGKPNGKGVMVSAIDFLKGGFIDGRLNGAGEMTLKDSGDKLIGTFSEGRFQGEVKVVHSKTGAVSTINVKDGKYQGDMQTKYPDGSTQLTQFNENNFPKSSEYKGINGSSEEIRYDEYGQRVSATYRSNGGDQVDIDKFYTSDSAHGSASFKGYKYSGDFKDLKFSGKGTLSRGKDKWKGTFKEGRLDGDDIDIDARGVTFKGSMWYDDKHSYQKGTVKFLNGDSYEGELRDFIFHGHGRLIHNDDNDCLILGLFCESNSFDITDEFTNGTSPLLQKAGGRAAPSEAFPDNQPFKVPMDTPDDVKENQSNSNEKILSDPGDYNNLDPTPLKPKNIKPPSPVQFWDPIQKKYIKL